MLVWSTQFPITPNHTTDDLLSLAKKWLAGSPHFKWQMSEFGEPPPQDLIVIPRNDQAVSIAKFSNDEGDFCGFRHDSQDAEHQNWTTAICGWRTRQKFLVSVQLFCEVTRLGASIPQPKKPYIVRQLLEELGGDLDGPFGVSDTPTELAESELETAVRLLRGDTDNSLPIVYASSTWRNQPALDCNELARWVSGMAHVVVEPSRRFSFLLASRANRENPYEGAVAICWPRRNKQQTRLYPYNFESPKAFAEAVADTTRQALAGSRPDRRCSWDFIRELVFNHRVETLRREGKASTDDYIRAFDDELAATRKQLESAELEVGRLKAELARTHQTVRLQEDGLLAFGAEKELYSGEYRDIVITALTLARNQSLKDGRVRHVLDSLLAANKPTGESDRLQKAIRDTVSSCVNLGTKERRALEDLGFSFTEDGKHLKLVFRGDDRYTFAMSKTGSDYRGMKNWASQTIQNLFK